MTVKVTSRALEEIENLRDPDSRAAILDTLDRMSRDGIAGPESHLFTTTSSGSAYLVDSGGFSIFAVTPSEAPDKIVVTTILKRDEARSRSEQYDHLWRSQISLEERT
jgi:hypothetical protein